MFIQKMKDLFNLNIPIGRMRYLVTYFVLFILLCPVLLILAPNILIYEGEQSLFSLFIAGNFSAIEIVSYVLLSGLLGYVVEFYIDSKRLLDISKNKKLAIIIAGIFLVLGVVSEFFVPVTADIYSIVYLILELVFFVFLCVKKGKMTHEADDEVCVDENDEEN